MAKEDKKYFKKLALKLNIPLIRDVIPKQFLEDDNYFNNEFDLIINSYQLDKLILVLGGRSFLRLSPERKELLIKINHLFIFTSEGAAMDQNFINQIIYYVKHAKVECSHKKLGETIHKQISDLQKQLNDLNKNDGDSYVDYSKLTDKHY